MTMIENMEAVHLNGHKPSEAELLELEQKYCSFGDTVHYLEPPKFFERADSARPEDAARAETD